MTTCMSNRSLVLMKRIIINSAVPLLFKGSIELYCDLQLNVLVLKPATFSLTLLSVVFGCSRQLFSAKMF